MLNPQVPAQAPADDGSTFGNALARGGHALAASLDGFAQTIGKVTGVDALEKWGKRGVAHHIQQMVEHPPEIRDWDDVDSLADFGTYALETLGEAAPALAAQILGMGGASRLARARAGKALRRSLGEKGYANYQNYRKAIGTDMQADEALIKAHALEEQAAQRAAVAGAIGASVIPHIGETTENFDQQGIEDPNGNQALFAGAIKGVLDTAAPLRVLGLSRRLGVPPHELPHVLAAHGADMGLLGLGTQFGKAVLKEGVSTAALGALTGTAQTFVDQAFTHANKPGSDLFSDENKSQILDSMVRGGLLSGVMASGEAIRHQFPAYARAAQQAGKTIDNLVPAKTGNAYTPPESAHTSVVEEEHPLVPAQEPEGRLVDDGTNAVQIQRVPATAVVTPPVRAAVMGEGAKTLETAPQSPVKVTAADMRLAINGLPEHIRAQVLHTIEHGTPEEKAPILQHLGALAEKAARETRDVEAARRLGGQYKGTALARENVVLFEDQGVHSTVVAGDTDPARVERIADAHAAFNRDPVNQYSTEVVKDPLTGEPKYAMAIQDRLPDELSPVPYTDKPSPADKNVRMSTVERVQVGLQKARENGQKRADNLARYSQINPETGRHEPRGGTRGKLPAELDAHHKKNSEQHNTILWAKDKAGNPAPMSLMDLTTMGMDILGAEGLADETSTTEFRLRGLEQGLSSAAQAGYDVSSAYRTHPKTGKPVGLRPELIHYFGRLSSKNSERQSVGAALKERAGARRHAPSEDGYEHTEHDFDPYRVETEIDPVEAADQMAQHQTNTMQDDAIQDAQGHHISTRDREDALADRNRAAAGGTVVHHVVRNGVPLAERVHPLSAPVANSHHQMEVTTRAPGVNDLDVAFTAGLAKHFDHLGLEGIALEEKPALGDLSHLHEKEANQLRFAHMDPVVQVVDGRMTITVPPLQEGVMGRASRQVRIAEAIGRQIFDQYLHTDETAFGPGRAQLYRRHLERAYKEETKKSSIDPVTFRKWFGAKTAAHVRALIHTKDPVLSAEGPMPLRKGIADRLFSALASKFRDIATEIHRIWSEKDDATKNNQQVNETVSRFLERVVAKDSSSVWWDKSKIDPKLEPNVAVAKPRERAAVAKEIPAAPEPSSGPGFFAKILEHSMDPASWKATRWAFSDGSKLRAMWEPLGELVEQQTYTDSLGKHTGKIPYHSAATAQTMKWNAHLDYALKDALKGRTKDEIPMDTAKAFELLAAGHRGDAVEGYTPQQVKLAANLGEYLDHVYQYMKPLFPDVHYEKNYFPRVWNTTKMGENPEAFTRILRRHGWKAADAQRLTEEFLAESTNDGSMMMPHGFLKARKITDPVLLAAMTKEGYLNKNPIQDLLAYTRKVTTRVEYEKLKPDIDRELVAHERHLDKLVAAGKLSKEEAAAENARAYALLQNSLGLTPADLSSTWGKVATEVRALAGMDSLMFGGLAGMTEGAAVLLRTRGAVAAKDYAKTVVNALHGKTREEMVSFAESMGTIHSGMQAAMGSIFAGSVDSFNGPISKYLPKVLEWTGNESVAQFWRVVSTATARDFLLHTAREIKAGRNVAENQKFLHELHPKITADHILNWDAGGQKTWVTSPGEDAAFVSHAISRFVQETVVNPTAADAPGFARTPHGAMLMQLKGFNMTAHKRVNMGVYREIRRQAANGSMSQAAASSAMWLAAPVMALMALAALQEEIRQRIRSLGDKGVVAANYGDPERIASTLLDRAGITSLPFIKGALHPTVSNIAFEMGPVASHAYTTVQDLKTGDTTGAILHNTPVFSQVPALREGVYKGLETAGVRQ